MSEGNGRYEIADIKHAAAGRWPEILSAVGGIPHESLDGKHHPCPKCGGKDRFRLIDRDAGAVICNVCFNEGNGDGFAAIQWSLKCDFPTSLRLVAEHLGLETQTKGKETDVLTLVARSKRVTPAALQAYGAVVSDGAVVVPMFDGDGKRCSTFSMKPGGGKGKNAAGKPAGVFLPIMQADGELVPRLPKPGEDWLIVEGCKDAAALGALKYLAIGLPTCKMNQRFAPMLRGIHVILVPDRDRAGDTGAQQTAAKLHGLAASVKVAVLPSEFKDSEGEDVRDVLARPNGEQQLREAIDTAHEWAAADLKVSGVDNWPDVTRADGQTDVSNGLRFRIRHGSKFRWCDPWGKFIVWDGRRWAQDKALTVDAMARDVALQLWSELGRPAAAQLSREESTRCSSFIRNSNSARGIRAMIERVRSESGIPILPEQLDQHSHYLNLHNGTLDLRTMKLHSHDRSDWLTQLCPVTYDSTARAPKWSAFIEQVFGGDAELIDFVQRAVGYSLCGDVSEHVLFFCYGKGSNGKSTFLNLLLQLLGDYSCKASSELLLLNHGQTHPTGITDLFGKRFVACIEADEGKRLAESLVKEMTGGDRLRARRMREDYWEFGPTHKIWLSANHKPTIRGTDDGIWRRIKMTPFVVTFDEASKDRSMPAKLAAELPGILNWALAGYSRWQEFGLETPQVISDATSEYRAEMDVLGQFIEEVCIVASGVKVQAQALFRAYQKWVGDNGLNHTAFGQAVAERGFTKRKSGGNWYLGIAVRESDHVDEAQFR